jgi:hypothetical protein
MEGDEPETPGYASSEGATANRPPLPRPRPPEYFATPVPQYPPQQHLGVPSQHGPQMYYPAYQPQYPAYPPPQPQRSRITVFRVALLAALALLLLVPLAAIAFATARRDRAASISGQGVEAGGGKTKSNTGPGASATPGTSKGPAPTTVDGKVRQILADQTAALLGGDQAAFLGAVDPSAAKLRDDLTRRFDSLRQMQVKVWDPTVIDKVKTVGDGTATATVYVKYCFVVTTCDPMNFETATKWNVSAPRVTLLEFGTSDDLGPRPWEASELRSAVGERVVLSTTPKYASRLPSMLAAAEKAAALTDKYAKWGQPPSRYVVYLAGPDEWSSWYGIKQESWVAGFALPLTPDATEIVLNAARVDTKETLDVLRHEFTHVVTLADVERAYDQTWWLVEGIAEYVRVKGSGKAFDGVGDVRAYVRSGRWQNEIAMDDPPESSTTADVSGRYGVAFMSVTRIAERFGEDKMLDFFNLTARQGTPLNDAAQKTFGVTWDDVAADCVKYVRNHI